MFSDPRIMNKDCHMFEAGLSVTCKVKMICYIQETVIKQFDNIHVSKKETL